MASSYNNDSLSITPSWPSLYNPRSELFDIQRHNPIQPGGFYLVNSQDVFRFTLYWTLVFYIPVFVLFGLYAFFNLTFPPHTNRKIAIHSKPYISYSEPSFSLIVRNSSKPLNTNEVTKANKSKNAARSRITFALLVFFGFLILSLIGAVVSSAIVGYILTGLYKAGKFYMSTWVPFLWAAISVMVGMLNVWPSVINMI
ncbi:hypothetical protein EV368DRAFT_45612 [Lentinula lateritia]|uniref:Uncharacterized protein n=1 Tax=Lentinula aff. lateritia TaxID=2804960 RepID=A0ACC1TJH9_9AGAR|nr:hypothetical protein F5876DRAFT_52977 [Lentinula aff. lateritia]KAJ3850301.1 hypothetical protein EV368DRAFT_45612 [Lentinula lateritia]